MVARASQVVDVLVDDSGRLGPLAYLVPAGVELAAGDAVTVPFGRQERHGLVLGPAADPAKATREVVRRLGQRVASQEMGLLQGLADRNFSSLAQVAARLSPSTGRNSAPLDAGELLLVPRDNDPVLPVPPRNWAHRLYLRPPLVDPARLAALEACRLAVDGQVLVLCPTVKLLERVLAEFSSGAARLDSKARAGGWNGWRSGLVRVGVGTRSAALYSADCLAGLIVVEEEHPGHVESSLPYTHARDLARLRAAAHRCALTLVSAAPTAPGMHGTKVLAVDAPVSWPKVEVIDRSCLHPSQRQVPPRVLRHVNGSLPVVVVAETRPSRRICTRCAGPRPCACGAFCAHRPEGVCPRCGTPGVRWVGWDAARVRASVPGASAMTLAELHAAEPADRVVVFLNVDSLFTLPGFDASSYALSSLVRSAEAAGRRGSLVLVSSSVDHMLVRAAASQDVMPAVRGVWDAARLEGLPPFGRLVVVRCNWAKPPRVDRWPGRVDGPRRRDGEWEILVRVDDAQFDVLRPLLERLRGRGKVRIHVR